MIVAEQKTIAEIKGMVAPYSKLLIMGCGTCVKTCFAGGEDEVATLASALRLAFKKDGKQIEVEEITVERQCEDEFLHQAASPIARNRLYCPWPAEPACRWSPAGSPNQRCPA